MSVNVKIEIHIPTIEKVCYIFWWYKLDNCIRMPNVLFFSSHSSSPHSVQFHLKFFSALLPFLFLTRTEQLIPNIITKNSFQTHFIYIFAADTFFFSFCIILWLHASSHSTISLTFHSLALFWEKFSQNKRIPALMPLRRFCFFSIFTFHSSA